MRILKSKKQPKQTTSYLKVLAEQARELRSRQRRPAGA